MNKTELIAAVAEKPVFSRRMPIRPSTPLSTRLWKPSQMRRRFRSSVLAPLRSATAARERAVTPEPTRPSPFPLPRFPAFKVGKAFKVAIDK